MDGLAVISRGLAVGRVASAEPVTYPVEEIAIGIEVQSEFDIAVQIQDEFDLNLEVV